MKKIAVILLLTIFLFNTMGYFVAFKAVQYQVKCEIKSQIKLGLNPTQLSIITINKEDLKNIEWFDDGEEMLHNNQRYDIVKSIENKTSITYFCINDDKETSLFTNLENHIETNVVANKPVKNQSSKKIIDNVIKLFYSNNTLVMPFVSSSSRNIFIVNQIYKPCAIETNSPPPEFV